MRPVVRIGARFGSKGLRLKPPGNERGRERTKSNGELVMYAE